MDAARAAATAEFVASTAAETGQRKVEVTFHGGEPLLAGLGVWTAFLETLGRRVARHRMKLAVQSNLWLLTPELCRLFKAFNVQLGTSLDGPPELNDRQRGEGYFARTLRGIQMAGEFDLPVEAIATVTAGEARHWPRTLRFFANRSLSLSVHAAVPSFRQPAASWQLSPEAYARVLRQTLGFYLRERARIRIRSMDQMIQSVACAAGRVCTFKPCLGMFLAIDALGEVYPCQRFIGQPEFRLGNIQDHPRLEDLLRSPAARRLQAREEAVKDACGACEHWDYCRGGCAYNGFVAGAPRDPYCRAYFALFSTIKRRMVRDMRRRANLQAIADQPYDGHGHPLLRQGPLAELARADAHPVMTSGTARRILGAVLLAMPLSDSARVKLVLRMGLVNGEDAADAWVRHERGRLTRPPRRNNLYLYVTDSCQLACSHCYIYSRGYAREGDMTPGEVSRLLTQARAARFRQVVILGGEPLLHRQRESLWEVLAASRQGAAPMNLVLRTNFAVPMTDQLLRRTSEAVDQIVVSVDGDEQSHDLRRGPGAYEKTRTNLETYQRVCGHALHAAELSLACVASSQEIRRAGGASVRALADSLGIRRVRFRPLLPLGRARDWEETPAPESLCAHVQPEQQLAHGFDPSWTCGLGQNLYVSPRGDVYPCYALRRASDRLGNLNESALDALLSSPACESLRQRTVDSEARCRTCSVRYLCGGACRAWRDSGQDGCGPLHERACSMVEAAIRSLRVPWRTARQLLEAVDGEREEA